jgi:SAM-dependent methyltransferase
VQRWAHLAAPGASVLDVACGHGRHAFFFARRGCLVTALDRDLACGEALAAGEQRAAIDFIVADLENAAWPLPGRRFDLVLVTRYLHRPLWPVLRDAVADGGALIYETFADGQQHLGRPRNPEFLLQPGELLAQCAGLHVLAYEDGLVQAGPARLQRLCALKPPLSQRALAVGPA